MFWWPTLAPTTHQSITKPQERIGRAEDLNPKPLLLTSKTRCSYRSSACSPLLSTTAQGIYDYYGSQVKFILINRIREDDTLLPLFDYVRSRYLRIPVRLACYGMLADMLFCGIYRESSKEIPIATISCSISNSEENHAGYVRCKYYDLRQYLLLIAISIACKSCAADKIELHGCWPWLSLAT
jgi:hypothetical protein